MKLPILPLLCVSGLLFPASATYAAQVSAEDIKAALIAQPEIFTEIIKESIENNKELYNTFVLEILQDNKELLVDIIQQGAESKRRTQLHAQWQEDVKKPKKVTIEGRASRGKKDAKVTLIAFSDFACTYCMQAAATIENLLTKYPDIHFVFKQNPSDSSAAQEASRWFLAALDKDEKKAWDFYAALFSSQKNFFADPSKTLREVATKVGFNADDLAASVRRNNAKYAAMIEEDTKEAKDLGFNGTPYFLMNNLVLRGAFPLEFYIDAYDFALKHVK